MQNNKIVAHWYYVNMPMGIGLLFLFAVGYSNENYRMLRLRAVNPSTCGI